MRVIDHEGDCTGTCEFVPLRVVVHCARCGHSYAYSPERLFAAEFDRVLAGHMQVPASDGAAILARERSR